MPYFGTNNAGYPAPLKFTVSVGGLDWEARLRWNPKASNDPIVEFHAGRTIHALQYKMLWSRAMDGEVSMVSQGFESHARMVPDEICQHEDVLVSARGEVRELEVMSAEKWPRKDELDQKQMRLAAIITELEREAAGPKDNAPAPPQHTVERTVSSGHTM